MLHLNLTTSISSPSSSNVSWSYLSTVSILAFFTLSMSPLFWLSLLTFLGFSYLLCYSLARWCHPHISNCLHSFLPFWFLRHSLLNQYLWRSLQCTNWTNMIGCILVWCHIQLWATTFLHILFELLLPAWYKDFSLEWSDGLECPCSLKCTQSFWWSTQLKALL